MYIVLDPVNSDVIGVHDNFSVVDKFVLYNFQKWNKKYKIIKIKEKRWEKIEEKYSGRYLIQYSSNYIPVEDLKYYGLYNDEDLDFQCNTTIDLLIKILESEKLSNKKQKAIEIVISMVEEVKDQKEIVSPSEIEYIKKHIGNLHEEF